MVTTYSHIHDIDSCETCQDFFQGPQHKEEESDADSGYCSGTHTRVEEKSEPLVVPTITITPLSEDELAVHNATLRAARDQRLTSSSTSTSSIDSPYSPRSTSSKPSSWSSRTSLYSTTSSAASSRTDLVFSTTTYLRPPEESYTCRLKDTWENRLAYPHYFPPPQMYSSRLNASLPTLLPSSFNTFISSSSGGGGGFNYASASSYSITNKNPSLISTEVAIRHPPPTPLSPNMLKKRTERDSIDAVRPDVLRRQQNPITTTRPALSSTSTTQNITSSFKPLLSTTPSASSFKPLLRTEPKDTQKTTTTTTLATPITTITSSKATPPPPSSVLRRRPHQQPQPQPQPQTHQQQAVVEQVVRKRWSIAGSAVGYNLSDTNSSPANPSPSSNTNPSSSPSNGPTPPTKSSSPLRNLLKKNDSSDSLSSLGSVTTIGSNNANSSRTTLGLSNGNGSSTSLSRVGRFKRFMGLYSTAPSSFRML